MNVVLIRCPNCSQLSRDLKTGRCGECLAGAPGHPHSPQDTPPTPQGVRRGGRGDVAHRPSPPFQVSGGRPGREASVSREVMTSVRADKGLDLPPVGLPKNLRRVP